MFGHFYRFKSIHINNGENEVRESAGIKSISNTHCSKILRKVVNSLSINKLSACPLKARLSLSVAGPPPKTCLFINKQAYKCVNDKINTVKSMSYKRCHIISIM